MICFAWSGFPQYAARCVRALVESTEENVVVVATRPRVPIMGMEQLAGCPVVWVENNDSRDISSIIGGMPRVLIVSGWGTRIFNQYRDCVREYGGIVVAMVDNNFIFSFLEIVKAIRFRLFFKRKYDGYLVPGKSSGRLLEFYGVSKDKIRKGLYAADETLFTAGLEISRREKKMMFVGQFVERKNIVSFAEAFIKANQNCDWVLEIFGCGPLRDNIPKDEFVCIHDFVQPEELADIYGSARVFALPSLEEHWGVVVHEAALSGCVLLLSDGVGAADDFLGLRNGYRFNPNSMDDMVEKIRSCMCLSDAAFLEAQGESIRLSRNASRDLFVESVKALIADNGG